MPNAEEGARSFLVRALPERGASDPVETLWRGYVISLPRGRQRYFERLDQIPQIVADFLTAASDEAGEEGSG